MDTAAEVVCTSVLHRIMKFSVIYIFFTLVARAPPPLSGEIGFGSDICTLLY